MSSILQKQKEDMDQDKRKEKLIYEIKQTQSRISHYKELENQIQSVSGLLKSQQQKSSKFIKQDQHQNPKRNSNTNKKIKIYELQKKLQARKKQYKDQHVIYLGKYKKQQEMITQISNTNKEIKDERDYSKELQRLTAALQEDICRVEEKCTENKNMLSSEKEVLTVYQQEKVKHIEQIKRMKKKIRKSSQNTEPDDDLALSVDEEEQNLKPLNFDMKYQSPRFRSTCQKSLHLDSKNKKSQKKQHYSVQYKMNEPQSQKKGVTFQEEDLYVSCHTLNNKQQNKSHINKSSSQIFYQINIFQEKLGNNNKMFESLLESISLVKRGNKNLQASIKHSAVTLDLLKMRAEAAQNNNKIECAQLLQNTTKSDKLYQKLRNKQGERGQIRGKLGIKVDNTRILGIINEELNFDLQKIVSKTRKLKNTSLQCKQIVQKFYNIFSPNSIMQ